MAERRRYTKREKASAVTAALAATAAAASDATGIPRRTIGYWLDSPAFAELRQKTREQLAEGSMVLANLAQAELQRKVNAGEVEPRDLAVIYGIAIDKAQLLSGAATTRTEHRDLTDSLPDHEKEALADAIDGWLATRADADIGGAEVGTGSEVRQ